MEAATTMNELPFSGLCGSPANSPNHDCSGDCQFEELATRLE